MILEQLLAAAASIDVQHLPPVTVNDTAGSVALIGVSAAAAGATVILALVTLDMARSTKALATETAESIRQARKAMAAERDRHMETFQPHLAIIDEIRRSPMPGAPEFELLTKFKNVGPGYAREISVRPDKYAMPYLNFKFAPPPVALAPGDEAIYATREVGLQQKLHGFTISYKDAFGRQFETIVAHPYTPGDSYEWKAPFKTS